MYRSAIWICLCLVLAGCEMIPTPGAYHAPSFSYVGYEVIEGERPGLDDRIILKAELSGNYGVTECGFRWGVDDWRLSEASIKTYDNTVILSLEGLQVNTVYYCHAFIRNGNSDICSKRISFKTNNSVKSTSSEGETTPGVYIVNFKDNGFREYALDICDLNSDGRISVSEAGTVEKMELCTDGISDLFGIGVFSKLKSLNCSGTLWNGCLHELNLDKNVMLQSLDCRYNRICYLSFPEENSLESLYCDFNELHSVDFSNLSKLRVLHCYGNRFENIFLKGMDSLEELYCGYNFIYSLDVSSNPHLKVLDVSDCVNLKTVYVSRGQTIETIIAPNSVKFEFVN